MLRKKEVYTVITPIPSFIPRQLALDILHSHSEVITLNPLVLDHKPIRTPQNAATDEYYSTWYEITERVQVVPGAGKVGSKQITFNGCFHDMPWGLQTHIYAPFGIDMRIKCRIGGNQPGIEPPETRELGFGDLDVPADGLYLREDIEFKCNVSLVSFVKAQTKAACKDMVQRFVHKAELVDAGALKAMMTPDGRIKTINPNDRSQTSHGLVPSPRGAMGSPVMYQGGQYPVSPGDYHQLHQKHQQQPPQQQVSPQPVELPSTQPPQTMELPGDMPSHYR